MNAKSGVCLTLVSFSLLTACGEEVPYVPKPQVAGRKANLPAVPTIPTKPKKVGDAYTVYGVTHDLRSRVHFDDVNGKKLSIVGYIVKTDFAKECPSPNGPGDDCVPKCAVHKTGKGDAADCKSPVPTFWIADDKAETKDMIAVMGWASNFAQMYGMIEGLNKAVKGKEAEVKLQDEFWGMDLPNPLPNTGEKIKVSGTYGITFTRATGGAAANPKYGILTSEKLEPLEPATTAVVLPGMKTK